MGFNGEEIKGFSAEDEPDLSAGSEIQAMFEVVVECRDEQEQKVLYQRLTSEGYSCRLFTL